ncbi:LacI family DNA-binding transcriptional regulator [Streptomyces sp. NPDC058914]|uniref:LacI family DNA-binding transcriptional regulator n=1 Tax=Streptomyces TaxID=1883 RepID=UPI0036C183BE
MGRRIGIKDVAAAAGVSVTTVSHILNEAEGKRINPEPRQRVLETARRRPAPCGSCPAQSFRSAGPPPQDRRHG